MTFRLSGFAKNVIFSAAIQYGQLNFCEDSLHHYPSMSYMVGWSISQAIQFYIKVS